MAEIPDPFGRLGNFLSAEFETLSSSLKSAVGAAVKFASDQSKASAASSADLGKNYDDLRKALQELGDDIEDNLKSNKTLVDEIGRLAETLEKRKEGLGKGTSKDESSSIQREQLNVLNMILRNQQKAIAEKVAKFSPGVAGSPKKGRASLESIGFKPRGTDTVPAMLSPGEFIVNRRGSQRNRGVLDRINRGYKFGGEVKPAYLSKGHPEAGKATGATVVDGAGSATVKVEIKAENLTPSEIEKFKNIGAQISTHVEEGLKGGTRRAVAAWATGLGTALLGGQADFMQTLFGGGVADAVHFRKEMREIAFQTQGITGDFREMQASFSNLGTNIVGETGKSVDVLQRVYMANLKKGFKDQKAGLKVMKSGLFLSTMIGSEAEQTANLFGEWHRSLGLSSNEMEKMARDMRSVSMSTGVTGDELLDAMKSSESILKNLRNQGNLTSNVAKTVVEIMAEAKKTGFEEVNSKVMSAMSGTNSILRADSSTQALIFSMANRMGGNAPEQVLDGTFMQDRTNLIGFSQNLLGYLSDVTNGAVKSVEDIDNLGAEQKRNVTLALRAFGLEIGEAKNLISGFDKAGKGLAGSLEDLNKVTKSTSSTEEERNNALKKEQQLYLGAAMDYLSGVSEAASKDIGLSDAIEKAVSGEDFKNRNQDLAAMAGALSPNLKSQFGIGGTAEQMTRQISNLNAEQKTQMAALVASEQLSKMAKEQGKSVKNFGPELQRAITSGDNKKFRELNEEMSNEMKKLAVDEANKVDPQKELVLTLNKLNEAIRGYTSSFVGGIIDFLGGLGLLMVEIGIQTAMLGSLFGRDIFNVFSLFGKKFGSVGSKFDDFAKTMSSSDGMFKKFFNTYNRSRTKSSFEMMDIAEFRKFRKQGMSPIDAKKAVENMGGFKKKGVFGSLIDATDELGDSLKKNLVDGVETVGRKGNVVFNRIGKRINLFGTQVKDSFSGAVGAFKNARRPPRMMDIAEFRKFRKQGMSAIDAKKAVEKMGGFSKKKGIFSSLKDAGDEFIKGMTGKVGKLSEVIDSVSNSKVIKFVRGSFDSLFKSFAKGKKAFSVMRSGNKNIFSSFAVGFDQFSKNLTGGVKPFEKMSSIFSSFIGKIKNFKFSSLKSLPGMLFRGVKTVVSGGIGGIFKGIGTALKGGSKLVSGGLRAALVGGTMGTAQLIFSAIDMVFGAVTGFQNTGKNFEGVMKAMGKSTNDLTWGMYASSTIAGGLVGILDGLTFGMLRLSGIADFLEQTLSLVFYGLFSVIEGFISGIMVAVDMVRPALKSLYESFAGLGNALLGLFNAFTSIFGMGEAKNAGEAFATLYSILKPIGKLLGMIIGVPLGAVLWTLVKVLGVVVNSITFTINMFTALVNAIVAPFKWLFNILVGNSIVPDLCVAIVGFFGNMALNVVKSIGKMAWNVVKTFASLPVKAVKFVASLPGKVFKGLQNVFFKAPKKVFEKIFKHLNTKTLRSGLGVISEKFGTFFGLFKNNLSGLTKFFKNSWYDFLNASTGGLFGKLVDTIKNSKMYKYVDDFLIKPIMKGLSWIGEKAGSIFKNAFDWIKGKVSKLIPGAKAAAEVASKVTQKVATKVAEKTGLKAAMESAKAARFAEFKRLRATGLSAEAAKAKMGKTAVGSAKDLASKATNTIKNIAKDSVAKVAEKTGLKTAMESSKAARFAEFKRLRATGLSAEAAKAKMGSRTFGVAKELANKGMAKATEMAPKTTGLLKAGASRVKDFAKSVAGKGGSKAATAAVSGVDDVAKAAGPALGFLGKSSKLIGNLAKKLPVVGPLLDFGIRKVAGESTGKALTGAAAGGLGAWGGAAAGAGIGTFIGGPVGTIVGGILGGILGIAGGVGAGMASDAIYDITRSIPNHLTQKIHNLKVVGTPGSSANKAAEKASAKMESNTAAVATPVGQHAIPVVHPEQDDQINNVQPTHLNDISESILRDRAGSSGQTSKLQSDELSRIEEASTRQVEELEQIRSGISELVALMKPKGVRVGSTDEMGAGITKDPRRPLHAAKFGKMKYSKAGSTANRNTVNDGES